jgi:hypothetical protein
MGLFSRNQKKEAELNGNLQDDVIRDIREIRHNLLQTVNSAVIAAKYMEIITASSDNINAKISPEYLDLVPAITAKSGDEVAIEPKEEGKEGINPKAEGNEGTRRKANDELRAEILARTWIGLDGDIAMILPKNRVGINTDPEILQLHKANVDVAVQNWRYFLDTMIKGVQILAGFTLPVR